MLALSDAGIPMLCLQVPAAAFLLLPVVGVEALVVSRFLGRPLRAVAKTVFLANLFSFFVGLPLAWVFMFVIQIIAALILSIFHSPDPNFGSHGWSLIATIATQSAWIPGEGGPDWIIPGAFLVLMAPYFFVSVMTERRIMSERLPEIPPYQVRKAAWLANLASYAVLALWAGIEVYLTAARNV